MQKEPLSLLGLAQPKIVRAFRKKFTSAALEHRPVFDCGFIHRDIAPYRRINSPERNFKKPPNIRLAEWRSVSQKTTPIDEFQLIHDHRNISTAITCVEATLLLSIGWSIYILTCGLTLTYVRSAKTRSCNSTAVSSAWISSGWPRKLAGGLLRRSGTSATNSPQKCRLDYTQSNNIGISVIFLYSFTTKLRPICSLLSVWRVCFLKKERKRHTMEEGKGWWAAISW